MSPTTGNDTDRIALAWTGASGSLYGLRLLEQLLAAGVSVELIVSKAAQVVLAQETDLDLPAQPEPMRRALLERYGGPGELQVYGREQWTAPLASGSNAPRAMVICPCTSGTVAALASGGSDNLIERAADVVLKERRQLVLVPRETPLSVIHLDNLQRLAHMGVTVLPANPGFYHRPQSVQDLVDFVVARILDHLAVPHQLVARWGTDTAQGSDGASG